MTLSQRWQLISLAAVFLVYAFLITKPINLFTADLGRHLQNGRIILETRSVPTVNDYSYTHPDYPFVNHHWGSGVVFHATHQLLGFTGLSLLFTAVSLAALAGFFFVAYKAANLATALLTSLILMPLLIYRVEVRPEVFSNAFLGLYLALLWLYHKGHLPAKFLYFLPLLHLFWVNLHIYAVFGLVVIGSFWLEHLIRRRRINLPLTLTLLFCSIASLINPAGLQGALYPLNIFKEYGYLVFENQSVRFIDALMTYPPNFFFKLSLAVLLLSYLYRLSIKKPLSLALLLLSLLFAYLGWTAIRNFTLSALIMLPAIAANLYPLIKPSAKVAAYITLTGLAGLLILFYNQPSYYRGHLTFGAGLDQATFQAANFFTANQFQGPVFNNYDIGGYLIYTLYPQQKVFVDNRPEAYPAAFFTDTYIPMQADSATWEQLDREYQFNTIFFNHQDHTPWAQAFLIDRIQDPAWAPVYYDPSAIIFLKRQPANQANIDLFELPASMFVVR
jgi:hypothetical protein